MATMPFSAADPLLVESLLTEEETMIKVSHLDCLIVLFSGESGVQVAVKRQMFVLSSDGRRALCKRQALRCASVDVPAYDASIHARVPV
jgi:hypothetical protein